MGKGRPKPKDPNIVTVVVGIVLGGLYNPLEPATNVTEHRMERRLHTWVRGFFRDPITSILQEYLPEDKELEVLNRLCLMSPSGDHIGAEVLLPADQLKLPQDLDELFRKLETATEFVIQDRAGALGCELPAQTSFDMMVGEQWHRLRDRDGRIIES